MSDKKINKVVHDVKTLDTMFIIVTGGVCSSIGKGVLVSSIGVLLSKAGYSVSVLKCDPYLNVDPGTMAPMVHGEVFVTADGAETDLDLGHYERMLGVALSRDSSISSGQIYQEVLDGERTGAFLGKCIQFVPHVVNVAKERLLRFALTHRSQFVLIEIGGTVGDMEGELFLETIRQLRMELGSPRVMHCHLGYVPYLTWTNEVKTKPTQHSVIALKKAGLVPDCLFLRTDKAIDQASLEKLGVMCGVSRDYIFQVLTYDIIYQLFLDLDRQKVGQKVQQYFFLSPEKSPDLSSWQQCIGAIKKSTKQIRIGLVAKYVGGNDPYISVIQAIKSAGYAQGYAIELDIIDAQHFEDQQSEHFEKAFERLRAVNGIVVPGGFDGRGVEGKIFAARFARQNKVPYLGLCLGMQVMVIEFARSVLEFTDANSAEFNADTRYPVIALMHEQKGVTKKGATMRLGAYPCTLKPGTKAYTAYQKNVVLERHRHRYEVNNAYKEVFEPSGMTFSGMYVEKNLVEIAEVNEHPFMVGTQFHPEFVSSPLHPHPLFVAFMQASIDQLGNVVKKKGKDRNSAVDQGAFLV